jgi:hypothetical protein
VFLGHHRLSAPSTNPQQIVLALQNMASQTNGANGFGPVRFIKLSYESADSTASALRLITTLFPDWEHGNIEFVKFTDGITNTVR